MTPQYFKGDDTELKFDAVGADLLANLSLSKDQFLDGAYETGPLGDLIVAGELAPLANAIDPDIFRTTFKQIFEAFVKVGTFEAYLTVFRKIFGEDVDVEFTVPGPGQLIIDITAEGLELSDFEARSISGGHYLFDDVLDREGSEPYDVIAFRTVLGFISEYELNRMLFEMVPAGIYTEITLDI